MQPSENTDVNQFKKIEFFWLHLVYFVFFLSGFSAMVYQLIWQRCLFRMYGINIESVTVIVTAFMLGLGLGCLAGGWISGRTQRRSILLFGLIELGIGLFGFFSLNLFQWVGSLTLMADTIQTALCSFALLLFPTLLMGATLPLLISHWTKRFKNVGFSVSKLYSVNTLGSAAAAYLCVLWVFKYLGLMHSVWLAASFNFLTAAVAFLGVRESARDS